MKFTKSILIFAIILLTTALSCKEKTTLTEASCFDGFLNNGETGIDCGGPCEPCSSISTPVFFAAFNGEFTSFYNVSLQYGDTIYMNASTDSIEVLLAFKNLSTPDENNLLNPLVTTALPIVKYKGVNYNIVNPQYSVVTINNDENNRISGLFQLFLPHSLNVFDTLKVVSGTFMNIPY